MVSIFIYRSLMSTFYFYQSEDKTPMNLRRMRLDSQRPLSRQPAASSKDQLVATLSQVLMGLSSPNQRGASDSDIGGNSLNTTKNIFSFDQLAEYIRIANGGDIETKQRSVRKFQEDLDPRDKQLLYPFDIHFNLTEYRQQVSQMEEEMKQSQDNLFKNHPISQGDKNIAERRKELINVIRNRTKEESGETLDKYYRSLREDQRGKERQKITSFLEGISQIRETAQRTTSISDSVEYQRFLGRVHIYLSQMVETVNSIAFNLLAKQQLTNQEVKAFASKNILQNIQILLKECRSKFADKMGNGLAEDLSKALTRDIDNYLKELLNDLASHYPQASAGGETARMRQVILNVNRSEDETNDLIFTKNIQIEKYSKKEKEDQYLKYSGFIMEVINIAINATRQPFSDNSDYNVFQKFSQFTQKLFCVNHHEQYRRTVTLIEQSKNDETDARQQGNLPLKSFLAYYQKILNPNLTKYSNRDTRRQFQQPTFFSKVFSKKSFIEETPRLQMRKSGQVSLMGDLDEQKYDNFYEQVIQSVRQEHKYTVSQKIPNSVKTFSQNDIRTNNFHIGSSTILRIMTKWAQYLEQIFRNPVVKVTQRIYSFKNTKNQIVNLDKQWKTRLSNKIKQESREVQAQLNKLKQKNLLFQSYFLCRGQQQQASFLRRFTQVRQSASRINAVLIEATHQYLCVLIHHLLKAGSEIQNEKAEIHDINLVIFRVSDLLRSKFQCSQSTFISILKTLNLLEESKQLKDRFKLVRIKNKLNQKDNNILINYLFGKVQCQLQLSIQNTMGKQKNYNKYCHFLYELTRGKFGVLTELSNIISHHDPVVNNSTQKYYHPKRYPLPPRSDKKAAEDQQQRDVYIKDENLYICRKCNQLKIRENIRLFNQLQLSCNQCIINSQDEPRSNTITKASEKRKYKQDKLQDTKLRQYLLRGLYQSKQLKRVAKYDQLKSNSYLFTISNEGKTQNQLKLYRTYAHERQLKFFLVELNNQILLNFEKESFRYNTIDYFDVSLLMQKGQKIKQLVYQVSQSGIQQAFNEVNISSQAKSKVQAFIQAFGEFRLEKNLIKNLKFKTQIIDISEDAQKSQALQLIDEDIRKKGMSKIKYKKYKITECKNVKKLQMDHVGLRSLNKIQAIAKEVTELNINGNEIKELELRKCRNLEILRCSYNFNQKIPFQKIDLSKNIALQDLQLSQDLIQNIDLSANVALTTLKLMYNKLQKLDLSSNTNLTTLNLSQNNISSISLTTNTLLTNLNLSFNNLTSLDLSKNTALTHIDLTRNQLTTLNLNRNFALLEIILHNNKIESMDLTRNIHLQEINLSENQIQKLDLTKNTRLKMIRIKDNPLRQIDLVYNTNLVVDNISILKQSQQNCVVQFYHEERDKDECSKLKNALELGHYNGKPYTFILVENLK